MFTNILAALAPYLLELIAAALTPLIAWLALRAHRHFGIEIEARDREALHSALMSGIRWALGRNLSGQAAVSAAVDYAARSVPDALGRLHPSPDVLHDLASAKLREVTEHLMPLYLIPERAQNGGSPADGS